MPAAPDYRAPMSANVPPGRTNYADSHTLAELLRQLHTSEQNSHRWGQDDPLGGLRGILADAYDEYGDSESANHLRTPGRHVIGHEGRVVPGRFTSAPAVDAYHQFMGHLLQTNEGDYPVPDLWVGEPGDIWAHMNHPDHAGEVPHGHVRIVDDAYPFTEDNIRVTQVPGFAAPQVLSQWARDHVTEQPPFDFTPPDDPARAHADALFRAIADAPFEEPDPIHPIMEPSQEPDMLSRTNYAGWTGADDFEAKIDENPLDATVHGVYADWLDEQGTPEAAEEARFRRAMAGVARSGFFVEPEHELPVVLSGWKLPDWAGNIEYLYNERGPVYRNRSNQILWGVPAQNHHPWLWSGSDFRWRTYRDMEEGLRRAHRAGRQPRPTNPLAGPREGPEDVNFARYDTQAYMTPYTEYDCGFCLEDVHALADQLAALNTDYCAYDLQSEEDEQSRQRAEAHLDDPNWGWGGGDLTRAAPMGYNLEEQRAFEEQLDAPGGMGDTTLRGVYADWLRDHGAEELAADEDYRRRVITDRYRPGVVGSNDPRIQPHLRDRDFFDGLWESRDGSDPTVLSRYASPLPGIHSPTTPWATPHESLWHDYSPAHRYALAPPEETEPFVRQGVDDGIYDPQNVANHVFADWLDDRDDPRAAILRRDLELRGEGTRDSMMRAHREAHERLADGRTVRRLRDQADRIPLPGQHEIISIPQGPYDSDTPTSMELRWNADHDLYFGAFSLDEANSILARIRQQLDELDEPTQSSRYYLTSYAQSGEPTQLVGGYDPNTPVDPAQRQTTQTPPTTYAPKRHNPPTQRHLKPGAHAFVPERPPEPDRMVGEIERKIYEEIETRRQRMGPSHIARMSRDAMTEYAEGSFAPGTPLRPEGFVTKTTIPGPAGPFGRTGRSQVFGEFPWAETMNTFERVLAANPDDADVRGVYADYLDENGLHELAQRQRQLFEDYYAPPPPPAPPKPVYMDPAEAMNLWAEGGGIHSLHDHEYDEMSGGDMPAMYAELDEYGFPIPGTPTERPNPIHVTKPGRAPRPVATLPGGQRVRGPAFPQRRTGPIAADTTAHTWSAGMLPPDDQAWMDSVPWDRYARYDAQSYFGPAEGLAEQPYDIPDIASWRPAYQGTQRSESMQQMDTGDQLVAPTSQIEEGPAELRDGLRSPGWSENHRFVGYGVEDEIGAYESAINQRHLDRAAELEHKVNLANADYEQALADGYPPDHPLLANMRQQMDFLLNSAGERREIAAGRCAYARNDYAAPSDDRPASWWGDNADQFGYRPGDWGPASRGWANMAGGYGATPWDMQSHADRSNPFPDDTDDPGLDYAEPGHFVEDPYDGPAGFDERIPFVPPDQSYAMYLGRTIHTKPFTNRLTANRTT